MLDIHFLIPLDIRDTALRMSGLESLINPGTNSKNSEVKAIMADKQDGKYNIMNNAKAREVLTKLANGLNESQSKPKPSIAPKALKNTVSGDVVKIIKKLPFHGSIVNSLEITSFFVFGISDVPQYVITNYAETFGKLKHVSLVHNAGCGFIQFHKRTSAEAFAASIKTNGLNSGKGPGLLILENKWPIRVAWGQVQSLGNASAYKKISLVVTKIMVELSKNPSKTEAKRTPKPKVYEASKNDFEL